MLTIARLPYQLCGVFIATTIIQLRVWHGQLEIQEKCSFSAFPIKLFDIQSEYAWCSLNIASLISIFFDGLSHFFWWVYLHKTDVGISESNCLKADNWYFMASIVSVSLKFKQISNFIVFMRTFILYIAKNTDDYPWISRSSCK